MAKHLRHLTKTNETEASAERTCLRTVYVSKSFKKSWNHLFDKFGRKGQDKRDSINAYYRESIELIKKGVIGRFGSLEVKLLEYVPSKGNGRFFECKQRKISGTDFCPRILFVNVVGTSHSILLDVIDKDGNNIDSSILSALSSKYKMAMQSNYENVYSCKECNEDGVFL